MQVIDISDLTQLGQKLLSQILPGEEIIITIDNKPVAKIVQINELIDAQVDVKMGAQQKSRQAGLSNSVVWISPDFDEPLEEFKEYM